MLDTIELIPVPVIIDPVYDNGEGDKIVQYDMLCPNCQRIIDSDKEGMPDYCVDCGQRIDYSKVMSMQEGEHNDTD